MLIYKQLIEAVSIAEDETVSIRHSSFIVYNSDVILNLVDSEACSKYSISNALGEEGPKVPSVDNYPLTGLWEMENSGDAVDTEFGPKAIIVRRYDESDQLIDEVLTYLIYARACYYLKQTKITDKDYILSMPDGYNADNEYDVYIIDELDNTDMQSVKKLKRVSGIPQIDVLLTEPLKENEIFCAIGVKS